MRIYSEKYEIKYSQEKMMKQPLHKQGGMSRLRGELNFGVLSRWWSRESI